MYVSSPGETPEHAPFLAAQPQPVSEPRPDLGTHQLSELPQRIYKFQTTSPHAWTVFPTLGAPGPWKLSNGFLEIISIALALQLFIKAQR